MDAPLLTLSDAARRLEVPLEELTRAVVHRQIAFKLVDGNTARVPCFRGGRLFAVAIIAIPGTSDVLLLEDYWEGPKVFANLSRVREDGTEVWRAAPPLPTSPDSWTQARVEGTEVTGYSWSGFVVRLDLETGQELSREFVK